MTAPVTAVREPAAAAASGSALVRVLPTAALLAATWILAWRGQGSIAIADWLLAAIFAALLLATILASGTARWPGLLPSTALGALTALAAWEAASAGRSASPSGARDEALLTTLYAVTLTVVLLTLRSARERLAAVELTVAALATLALATVAKLIVDPSPALYYSGRLNFPLTYVNASAALFALGFWPAIVLAGRRAASPLARAGALSAATVLLAASALAQSKGSAVALVASAIVVLALVPQRLRLLAPTAVAAALTAAGFRSLTGPYRTNTDAALEAAMSNGAEVLLLLAAAGAALGLVLALADRRLELSEHTRRALGMLVLTAFVAGCAIGVAVFFSRVDHPRAYVAREWESFKHRPVHTAGSTHLFSLGSNRYDFWRVAVDEFRAHPLTGIGSRGFYSAYLLHRRSDETPLRAHSLYLDVLSESGVVGFAALATGLGPLIVIASRRRQEVAAAAALGAGAYFLAHAAVDWVWTFPALGIPFFLLLGAAAAGEGRALSRRSTVAATGVAVALALFAFAPPYLAARFTAQAYSDPAAAASDLRWARRLDPLSLDPLFARWRLASTPAGRIEALEQARRMAPRSVAVQYQLGLAYLAAGRRADAERRLETAHRLDPGERVISAALRRASG